MRALPIRLTKWVASVAEIWTIWAGQRSILLALRKWLNQLTIPRTANNLANNSVIIFRCKLSIGLCCKPEARNSNDHWPLTATRCFSAARRHYIWGALHMNFSFDKHMARGSRLLWLHRNVLASGFQVYLQSVRIDWIRFCHKFLIAPFLHSDPTSVDSGIDLSVCFWI